MLVKAATCNTPVVVGLKSPCSPPTTEQWSRSRLELFPTTRAGLKPTEKLTSLTDVSAFPTLNETYLPTVMLKFSCTLAVMVPLLPETTCWAACPPQPSSAISPTQSDAQQACTQGRLTHLTKLRVDLEAAVFPINVPLAFTGSVTLGSDVPESARGLSMMFRVCPEQYRGTVGQFEAQTGCIFRIQRPIQPARVPYPCSSRSRMPEIPGLSAACLCATSTARAARH